MKRSGLAGVLIVIAALLAGSGAAQNPYRVYFLQEILYDHAFPRFLKSSPPPVVLHRDAALKVEILGGKVELRPNGTFALELNVRVTRGGSVQAGPWRVFGNYRPSSSGHIEFASTDKTGVWDRPSFEGIGTFEQGRYGVLNILFDFYLENVYEEKVSCTFK
jgi:hypothetical protein